MSELHPIAKYLGDLADEFDLPLEAVYTAAREVGKENVYTHLRAVLEEDEHVLREEFGEF